MVRCMATAIWAIILVVNLVLGLLKKHYKLIAVISLILIVLLVGGNYDNADFSGYNYYYRNQIYPASMEIGFTFFSSVCNSLGMDYQAFVLSIMAVLAIIAASVVIYFKVNPHVILFLYSATLLFLDAVQIRQTIAYVLFTLSLLFLAKRRKIIAALVMFIACLFQITTVIFVPIIFMNPERQYSKKIIRGFVAIIFMVCLFVFVSGSSLLFISNIMQSIISSDKMVYFNTRTRFGFVIYFIFQFSCMYIVYTCKNKLNRDEQNPELLSFANYVFLASMYACVGMPLVMLNNNFSRFFKYTMIGCFVLIARIIGAREGSGNLVPLGKRYYCRLGTYSVFVGVYVLIYELTIQIMSVFTDVLAYNVFF